MLQDHVGWGSKAGYVAEYQLVCVGLELDPEEREEYDKHQKMFVKMKMALGGHDAWTKAGGILAGTIKGNQGVAAQYMNAVRGRRKVIHSVAVVQNASLSSMTKRRF